jgi:hypothetical protein
MYDPPWIVSSTIGPTMPPTAPAIPVPASRSSEYMVPIRPNTRPRQASCTSCWSKVVKPALVPIVGTPTSPISTRPSQTPDSASG